MLEYLGRTRLQQGVVIVFSILGISIILLNIFAFQVDEKTKSFLNLLASLCVLLPPLVFKYRNYRRDQEIEARFPEFLRDVADAINSGMTLPQAIKHVAKNEYGVLTPLVKKIAVQIDWGMPFEKVFRDFGEKTKNRVIKRAISTIIETHRSGGKIAESLVEITNTLVEITKIRKERLAHVYHQIITGYIIYFVFLGIMIGLIKFLLPGMLLPAGTSYETGSVGVSQTSPTAKMEIDVEIFFIPVRVAMSLKDMFFWLTMIEGVFSGLAIGKMAEGTMIAGFKHSLILCSLSYAAFVVVG